MRCQAPCPRYTAALALLATVVGNLLATASLYAATAPAPDTVVVLLVDGLNGEMIDRFATPTLHRLRAEGSWTHRFEPTFPAISGPTWVSLSTGCWPQKHGIVTDKFWDPALGLMDHATDPRWLERCELLQTVAERQGVKVAALGWWGQLAASGKQTATFVSARAPDEARSPRDSLVYASDEERAREIETYLRMSATQRPRLILGYFRGPDHDAHFKGLGSRENEAAVRRLDAALGHVLRTIQELGPRRIALLIASDHGMVPVKAIINVNRILRRHDIDVRAVTTGTTGFLYFDKTKSQDTKLRIDAAYVALSKYEAFEVWRKNALPDYVRIGQGPRVADLIIAAKPGYYTADPDLWPWYLKPLTVFGNDYLDSPLLGGGLRAAHGYPPGTAGNDGVFYAWGDGLNALGEMDGIRMIDIHPTVTKLLSIAPGSTVDGTAIERLIATPQENMKP